MRDAVDIIIEKILDRNTIAPLQGFTNEELLRQVELQNSIMDNHEDYAALRSDSPSNSSNSKKGGHKDKKQIAKGIKGISKIVTADTVIYPPMGSLELSSEFIPKSVFLNTDIVEFKEGKVISYVSDSPYAISKNR
jgi:hypothetical protein